MPPASRHPFRITALLLCALLVAVLLLATALTLFWPTVHLRSSLADLASDRLGVPVTIDGDAQVRLWPRPALRINDVSLDDGSLAAGRISLRWLPLLRGQFVPASVYLDTPVLNLVRDENGVLNIDPRDDDATPAQTAAVFDLHIRQGTLHWHDQARDQRASVTALYLSLPALRWRRARDGDHPLSRLNLSAEARAETLHYNTLALADISLGLSVRDGALRSSDWQMSFLDSAGTAEADMDFSSSPASWALALQFDALQAAALPEAWLPGDGATGSAALTLSLTSQGNETDAILRHLDGAIRLSGRDMVLHGMDLDQELARFQRTQRFSLVDAGAFIFAGPIGLAATKGSEFARLLDRADGDTRITHLLSDWTVEDGVAHARDVAMATERNRIALRADLDLSARSIQDAAVAVINQDGCAVIQQRIRGSFDAPDIDEPAIVDALLGAPLALLQRGLDALSIKREDCDSFYNGEVSPPADD
ncbi:AsmA family protein [Alcanivorax sp. JB21]|uniref:AsmA family protein n=1 Tax=Alcanivorax limicola TaxID=2874102 RepID=UPI001CC11AC6|nr:AsmA family protein [Alcanivorax limicola]MBZ2188952.1 AsmA family protein [Alcanivorax limicola]